MKYTLSLRSPAVDDIDAGAAFYDAEQLGLGDRFRNEVATVLRSVESNPNLYPWAGEGKMRKAVLAVFPFCVYYRVENSKVLILAVHDSRRDPRLWRNRS
jgi:hypothetical protein